MSPLAATHLASDKSAMFGRVAYRVIVVAAFLVTAELSPADARQQRSGSPPVDVGSSTRKETPPASKDVVVTGVPMAKSPPTQVDADVTSGIAAAGRQAAADARLFSRCIKPFDNQALHAAIDGQPNRYVSQRGLDEIVRSHEACYPGLFEAYPRPKPPFYGDCQPRFTAGGTICQAFYDRGALIEKVLATYAADLTFTTAQLLDGAVFARFRARQMRFDKSTEARGRIYFDAVACMVALNPAAALQLLKAEPNGDDETRLRKALILTSPRCVGGATKVSVDPVQFRVYVADATYSWAVALRGTDTLIPLPDR